MMGCWCGFTDMEMGGRDVMWLSQRSEYGMKYSSREISM